MIKKFKLMNNLSLKREAKIIPFLEYLDKHEITLSAGENKELNYDEQVRMRSILVQTGDIPTKVEIFCNAFSQKKRAIDVNKENMILSGTGMLTIKNKYLKKQIRIDQPHEKIQIDITKEQSEVIKRRKNFLTKIV